MVKPVYKVLGILILIPVIFFYFHFWKNYSNNIKKLAEPIRENVLLFNNKYGRYPTKIHESLNLLNSSGYNAKDGEIKPDYVGQHKMVFVCKSIFKNMTIHALVSEPAKPYDLSFYKGYTRCHILFDENNRTNIRCYQNPIIDLGIRG